MGNLGKFIFYYMPTANHNTSKSVYIHIQRIKINSNNYY